MNKLARRAEESLDFEMCRRSCHHFIFGDHLGTRLKTKDEHDTEHPIKEIKEDEYLKVLLDLLLVSGKLIKPNEALFARAAGADEDFLEFSHNSSVIFIEKSRHVFATWLVLIYLLWRAKFMPHQLLIVQSKREDDAANLVFNKETHIGRMSFLETHLPPHLRTMDFPKAGSYCHLFIPNGSHVWAIPEGGDIIRSNNPSVIFSDEAAFQAEFGNAYTAAIPAIKGGGQLVAVSSANPGEFQNLVEEAA